MTINTDTTTYVCAESINNDNCDNATIYIDTTAIKNWGVDADGMLFIETTNGVMDQIGSAATTIA